MDYQTYRLLHVVGIFLLFLGLGGSLLARRSESGRAPAMATALHGMGLVVILVAGFGLMARLQIEWPWKWWLFVKLGVWLAVGAMPILVRRKVVPQGVAWLLVVLLGAGAAYLAINHNTL